MAHEIHTPEVEEAENDRLRRVSQLAFARFEARGGEHGHDIEDWLEAEQEDAVAWPPDARKSGRTAAPGRVAEGNGGAPETRAGSNQARLASLAPTDAPEPPRR